MHDNVMLMPYDATRWRKTASAHAQTSTEVHQTEDNTAGDYYYENRLV